MTDASSTGTPGTGGAAGAFMDGYPVVLRVAGRRALVVGGGQVGAAKARGLVAAGAIVTVVSPDVDASMPAGVRVVRRRFRGRDVRGQQLVYAATGDRAVNQRVYDRSERRGSWVCSVDDPDRCSFALPAVHRDGPVLIAVSTGGASPTLAQALRDRCAAAVPGDLAAVAGELARARATARAERGTSEGMPWRPAVDDLLDAAARVAAGADATDPGDPGRRATTAPDAASDEPAGPQPAEANTAGAVRTRDDDRWLRTLAAVTA